MTCCHTDKGSSSASINPAEIISLSKPSTDKLGTSTHNNIKLIAEEVKLMECFSRVKPWRKKKRRKMEKQGEKGKKKKNNNGGDR